MNKLLRFGLFAGVVLLLTISEIVSMSFLMIGCSLTHRANDIVRLLYEYRSVVASLTIIPVLVYFVEWRYLDFTKTKGLLVVFIILCFRWIIMISLGCIWIVYGG